MVRRIRLSACGKVGLPRSFERTKMARTTMFTRTRGISQGVCSQSDDRNFWLSRTVGTAAEIRETIMLTQPHVFFRPNTLFL